VRLGASATGLRVAESTLEVAGEQMPFDGLIIATGASPRELPCLSGVDHVYTLRTSQNALALRMEFGRAKHVAVIGAGFIGAEVAASARARGLNVTVVEMEQSPLARALGPTLGATMVDLHLAHGTEVRLGTAVVAGEQAADGSVRLSLSDGTTLEADVVVVGIGVTPNTQWLEGSGLELANGVVCDAALNCGPANIFAAGDVASWPNPLFAQRMRVEHWTNATAQARHAARNLLHGKLEPFEGSNYFWSDQYGVRIQFAGIATPNELIVDGSTEERRLLTWFMEDDRLVGAFAMANPDLLMKSKQLIEERASLKHALSTIESSVASDTARQH